ncbi:Protein CBG26411 [Caenorhabditis briggsae]|uniref:Protein CBG26411 n=1 Tax=Caenorhabditis briggsae TaxID=6238 RepID=B6ILE4_CAEBR|nr:Protein CBG26411 [Caenorhabditis briggsae]CAS00724.1 Protein CBG26411 [Caenorhabditis briggsae]
MFAFVTAKKEKDQGVKRKR